jgi:hypothetical protein
MSENRGGGGDVASVFSPFSDYLFSCGDGDQGQHILGLRLGRHVNDPPMVSQGSFTNTIDFSNENGQFDGHIGLNSAEWAQNRDFKVS